MASKNADEDAASQRPAPAPAGPQTTPAALRPTGSRAVEQRVVAALRTGDRRTAFVKACLLMKQAFEHPDVDQQLDLGRQALAFSPDLADLYVALTALVRARREALAHHLRGPAEPQATFGASAAPAAGLRRAPPRDQPDLDQPRRRAAEGDALHRRDRLGPPGRELLPVPEEGERDPRRGLPQDGRVDRQDDRRQADKDQGPRRPRPVPRPPRRLVGRRDGDGGGRVLGPVGRLVPPTRPGPTPTTPRRPRRGGRRYPVLTDIRNVAPVADLVDKFASQVRRHRLQPAHWASASRYRDASSRVAGKHCCFPATSELDVRVAPCILNKG